MIYFKMSMEIQLINQIEKYEFLYNFNLPEYNRKDLVDEAWANIAATINLSVSDCKEKWRNIRSSYLRSMKPSGSKVKKPYYLTEFLKFILPFLKPINIDNTDEGHYDPQASETHETEVVVDFIKEEPGEYVENHGIHDNNGENGLLTDLLAPRSHTVRKRRRFIPVGRRNIGDIIKTRGRQPTAVLRTDLSHNDTSNSSNSAMKMFLMSLLPELESMSEEQVRLFKIKSMMLVDDIKSNYPQMKQNLSAVNSERLQKKLINLLLKNLHRTTNDNLKSKES